MEDGSERGFGYSEPTEVLVRAFCPCRVVCEVSGPESTIYSTDALPKNQGGVNGGKGKNYLCSHRHRVVVLPLVVEVNRFGNRTGTQGSHRWSLWVAKSII